MQKKSIGKCPTEIWNASNKRKQMMQRRRMWIRVMKVWVNGTTFITFELKRWILDSMWTQPGTDSWSGCTINNGSLRARKLFPWRLGSGMHLTRQCFSMTRRIATCSVKFNLWPVFDFEERKRALSLWIFLFHFCFEENSINQFRRKWCNK